MNESKRLFKAIMIGFILVLLISIVFSIPVIGPFLKFLSDFFLFAFGTYVIYEFLDA